MLEKGEKMMYPNRLKKGDYVGICAPASPINTIQFIKGVQFLEEMGLQPIIGNNVYKNTLGYLAGTDEQRVTDLNEMLRSERIKAIIFARGGYGTARIASRIDYNAIYEQRKILLGYSDLTYLHTAIFKKTGLVTFHGPMVMTFGHESCDTFTKQQLQYFYNPTTKIYDETISPLTVLVEGEGRGHLIGGNLSIIISTLGTPFEINLKNKILFIEDVAEPLYKIDRLLNQLTHMSTFQYLEGIIIGDFNMSSNTKSDATSSKMLQKYLNNREQSHLTTLANDDLINELFYHYFKKLNIPIISGFKIGHCFPHFIIPHGASAQLDTKIKQLIIEPALK